jgi:hypothetical protein
LRGLAAFATRFFATFAGFFLPAIVRAPSSPAT